ncbi:probable serine/threonine-protein kinase PIX13 [Punica granatum]|uniref:non-specific serine/threonine protein kinase n=1 Tax=Punica granatum TaxID=22663 RepID=A0A6P8C8A1_PUNGR|nr:probable serine/threonine-protein kinase PIX13 [Punica granatum]
MGNCWGWVAPKPDTTTSASDLSKVGTSQATITATTSSSGSSGVSRFSQFTASSGGDPENANTGHILPLPNLRQFTLAELRAATKNFRSDSLLGEGGFGKVFKGWIDDKPSSKNGNNSGTPVAVKKLNSDSVQGIQEWRAEVDFLGRLSHPNLVKLLGYSIEDQELLLVYEYVQKGSLENHLFGRGAMVQALPWDIRLKIAIGAARGLAFLHTSEKQVIYRDFKASNILLDGFYNAKISDFGLAKTGPSESKSHVTTRVMGTYGYAAPEYVSTGHLYVKSDVFGFGVVLVEMLTGLRTLDPRRPKGQENLVDWVKPLLSNKRKLKNLMDAKLEGKYPSAAAYQIAQLALKCLALDPKSRPSMEEVVVTLEKLESSRPERAPEPKVRPARLGPQKSGLQNLHNRSPLHQRQNGSMAIPHQGSPRMR